jgi:hypothetical protein
VAAGAWTEGTLTDGTGIDGAGWSADATAARMSASPMIVAARRVRRLLCPTRLETDTDRIGSP